MLLRRVLMYGRYIELSYTAWYLDRGAVGGFWLPVNPRSPIAHVVAESLPAYLVVDVKLSTYVPCTGIS